MSSTPDKQSVAPTQRHSKRLRHNSSGDISIEELLSDDMGYDADVETLQPDQYEDAESDAESTSTPKKRFSSIDEELAARMKHLGNNESGSFTPPDSHPARGRKRRSLHQNTDSDQIGQASVRTSDFEVMEVLDRSAQSPPAKRRRRRSHPRSLNYRSDASHRLTTKEPSDLLATVRSRSQDAMDMS